MQAFRHFKLIGQMDEDDAGDNWMGGIARQWQDDLSDPRQDIYSLADGVEAD